MKRYFKFLSTLIICVSFLGGAFSTAAPVYAEEPANSIQMYYFIDYTYHTFEDSFINSEVTGQYYWHVHCDNLPDTTGEPVTNLTHTLESDLVIDQPDPEPAVWGPPVYQWGPYNLPEEIDEGQFQQVISLGSTAPPPVTYTPGLDVSRSVDKSTFTGVDTQTITVTAVAREPASHLLINVGASDDNNLTATIISPAPGTPGYTFYDDNQAIQLDILDPVLDTPYTLEVTLQITPKVAEVEFVAGTFAFLMDWQPGATSVTGGSFSHDIPVLGTWTTSADGVYEWLYNVSLDKGVFLLPCSQSLVNSIYMYYFTNYTYHTSEDSFINSEVTGQYNWHVHCDNLPDTTGEPVTNLTHTLESDLVIDQPSPEPAVWGPPIYQWAPVNLPENDAEPFQQIIGLGSTAPPTVTYTPGLDVSRVVDKSVFTGVDTQTITVTAVAREPASNLGINVLALDDNNVTAAIISPALGTPGYIFFNNNQGIQLSILDPVPGMPYTLEVTLQVTPKLAEVEFVAGTSAFLLDYQPGATSSVGGSFSHDIPVLGTWTSSADGSLEWGYAMGLEKQVFLLPRSQNLTNYVHMHYFTSYTYHTSEDNFINSEVTGQYKWHVHCVNLPDTTGEPVTNLTHTLESDLVIDQPGPEPAVWGPPVYQWGPYNLPEKDEEQFQQIFNLISTTSPPVTYTPGLDISRSVDKSVFTGPDTQTITVTAVARGPAPVMGINVLAWDDSNVTAAIISPAPGTPGYIFFNNNQGVQLDILDPVPNVLYTLEVTLQITPKVAEVEFVAGTSAFLLDYQPGATSSTGGSFSHDIPTLGTWTASADGSLEWGYATGLEKQVFLLPRFAGQSNLLGPVYSSVTTYTSPTNSFTNSEVTGYTSWQVLLANFTDATGKPAYNPHIVLESSQQFGWLDPEPSTVGPPVYEWSCGDIAEDVLYMASVGPAAPELVAFTPGFDAVSSVDRAIFAEPGVQNLTIAVTLRQALDTLLCVDVNTMVNERIDATIISYSGADTVQTSSPGYHARLYLYTPEFDKEYIFSIAIQVTPKAEQVEYVPDVTVSAMTNESIEFLPGPSMSYNASETGLWTWYAEGVYLWGLWVGTTRSVVFPGQSGSLIEDFSIKDMSVVFDRRPDRDRINISEATLILSESASYDLTVDDVTVDIDGVIITIPAGSFKQQGHKERYHYKSTGGTGPQVNMRLNFEKGEWTLKVNKIDASTINNCDGVDVTLTIGELTATEQIKMQISELTYVAED